MWLAGPARRSATHAAESESAGAVGYASLTVRKTFRHQPVSRRRTSGWPVRPWSWAIAPSPRHTGEGRAIPNKHAVAVAVEEVLPTNRLLIGAANGLHAGK